MLLDIDYLESLFKEVEVAVANGASEAEIGSIFYRISEYNQTGIKISKYNKLSDFLSKEEKIHKTVVQLNMNGQELFTSNSAIFATSKEEAKKMLGGAKKTESGDFLICDSLNKRVMVESQYNQIIWEYESDRYIIDADIRNSKLLVIKTSEIYEGLEIQIKQGTTIIWENDINSEHAIYSGNITEEEFELNSNLNSYSSPFYSPTLQFGESYKFQFENTGEQYWFLYPEIITVKTTISDNLVNDYNSFYVLESDGNDSTFTSQAIRTDKWGKQVWTFGNKYLVKPKSVQFLDDQKVLIGT